MITFFQNCFFYTGFLLQNRCPTRYEKKVEDGFDFPSDKSSVSFWIVRVGWVNLMLQSTCDGCWAQAWLAFQPVQFDLLESTSFCTSAFVSIIILGEKNQQYVSVSKKYTKNVLFLPKKLDAYLNGTRSFSQGYKNRVNFYCVGP